MREAAFAARLSSEAEEQRRAARAEEALKTAAQEATKTAEAREAALRRDVADREQQAGRHQQEERGCERRDSRSVVDRHSGFPKPRTQSPVFPRDTSDVVVCTPCPGVDRLLDLPPTPQPQGP